MPKPGQIFERLTPDDEERLRTQRAVIERYLDNDEKSRISYSQAPGKLRLLRAILKAKTIDVSNTYGLQCMGVVFGDAIVQECGWLWRMVEDEYGRDPCVKVPGSSMILFPLTMISKRIERGEEVDVLALFNTVIADTTARAKTADALAD